MTYSRRTILALLAVALMAVASLTAIAQEHPAALVLTHANLIDGSSPEPVRDAIVIIRGRQIERVGRNAGPMAAGAKVIDLKGPVAPTRLCGCACAPGRIGKAKSSF